MGSSTDRANVACCADAPALNRRAPAAPPSRTNDPVPCQWPFLNLAASPREASGRLKSGDRSCPVAMDKLASRLPGRQSAETRKSLREKSKTGGKGEEKANTAIQVSRSLRVTVPTSSATRRRPPPFPAGRDNVTGSLNSARSCHLSDDTVSRKPWRQSPAPRAWIAIGISAIKRPLRAKSNSVPPRSEKLRS